MAAEAAPILPIIERPPTLLGRLLGAFVCFQLVATPLSNYIKLVPTRFPEYHGEIMGDLQARLADDSKAREPMQTIFDVTSRSLSHWSELSGQGQCWALFTSFGTRAAFPVVELRWPNVENREPVRLTCYQEPADPTRYFYFPEPNCRLFNYEYRMAVFHAIITPEYVGDVEKYRQESYDCVRDMRRSMSAYLRWKSHQYLKDHPELPPVESITLIARVLPDPPAGSSRFNRPPAYEIPMARWQPQRPVDPANVPLDVWDPVDKKWVTLPIKRAS